MTERRAVRVLSRSGVAAAPAPWLVADRAIILERWVAALRWNAAIAYAVAVPRPPVRRSPVVSVSASASVGEFLACTRAHESDSAGGYQAVSPGGTYRGAYQFDRSTWDSTAASAGRPDLIGVDVATVAPADQDQLASALYATRGNQPWGGRC